MTRTTLTRFLAGTAIALTGIAGTAGAASATAAEPAPAAVQPQGIGDGVRGYEYWSWHWSIITCADAGIAGVDNGHWDDWFCTPRGGLPGQPWTTYALYVLR